MDKSIKNISERPITLSVEQVADVLGISRAGAYNLSNSKNFPVIHIGKRKVIPKDAFIWNYSSEKRFPVLVPVSLP